MTSEPIQNYQSVQFKTYDQAFRLPVYIIHLSFAKLSTSTLPVPILNTNQLICQSQEFISSISKRYWGNNDNNMWDHHLGCLLIVILCFLKGTLSYL